MKFFSIHLGAVIGPWEVERTDKSKIEWSLPFWFDGKNAEAARREAETVLRSAAEAVLSGTGKKLPRGLRISLQAGEPRNKATFNILDAVFAITLTALTIEDNLPEREIACGAGLSLSGGLRPIRGAASASPRFTVFSTAEGARAFVEANALESPKAFAFRDLSQVLEALRSGDWGVEVHPNGWTRKTDGPTFEDMQDPPGWTARPLLRAAQFVAVAGMARIPVLLVGPPGCGATMFARRITSLLPFTRKQAEDNIKTYDLAGFPELAYGAPPFRAPHHTVSMAGLFGVLGQGRPGEVELARHGVLFLDEAEWFSREHLRALLRPDLRAGTVLLLHSVDPHPVERLVCQMKVPMLKLDMVTGEIKAITGEDAQVEG